MVPESGSMLPKSGSMLPESGRVPESVLTTYSTTRGTCPVLLACCVDVTGHRGSGRD